MKLALEVTKHCDRIQKYCQTVEKRGDKKDIFLFPSRNFDKFRFALILKKEKHVTRLAVKGWCADVVKCTILLVSCLDEIAVHMS